MSRFYFVLLLCLANLIPTHSNPWGDDSSDTPDSKLQALKNKVISDNVKIKSGDLFAEQNAQTHQWALELDGVSDYIKIPDLDSVTEGLTVEMWFKANQEPSSKPWLRLWEWGNGPTEDNVFLGFTGTSGRLEARVWRFGTEELPDSLGVLSSSGQSAAIRSGSWNHVAVTFRPLEAASSVAETILFLNGAKASIGQSYVPSTTTRVSNFIGKSSWSERTSPLVVDEFRVWSGARSEEDIAADMSRELTGSEPGLLVYLKMNEGSGSTLHNVADTHTATYGEIVGEAKWVRQHSAIETSLAPGDEAKFTPATREDVIVAPELEMEAPVLKEQAQPVAKDVEEPKKQAEKVKQEKKEKVRRDVDQGAAFDDEQGAKVQEPADQAAQPAAPVVRDDEVVAPAPGGYTYDPRLNLMQSGSIGGSKFPNDKYFDPDYELHLGHGTRTHTQFVELLPFQDKPQILLSIKMVAATNVRKPNVDYSARVENVTTSGFVTVFETNENRVNAYELDWLAFFTR